MQKTSKLYQDLLSVPHRVETRLAIGTQGYLIDEVASRISIGGLRIPVNDGSAESGYGEQTLVSLKTSASAFGDGAPVVGRTIAGEIEITMLRPKATIPRRARLVPYVRLTDGIRHSEWIQKGVYYVDTRSFEDSYGDADLLHIHGYDAMMSAEQDYPDSRLQWPALDIDVVREIADFLGVPVDPRTVRLMTAGHRISFPAGYTCREVLGYIAALYLGSFVMSDLGQLRLITLISLPRPTNYLVTEYGAPITIGGLHIHV